MPPSTPLDLSSLSHYKRSITLPATSRNPVVAKLLTRYHSSTKHSEQSNVCLQLANHYFTTQLFRHALPYYAAALSHTVQCNHQHDLFPVLTLLRRLGECHHQLQHYSSAANSFHTALTLLALLCPAATGMTKKHWTLKQELLLSLGNSYQDWCDAEEEKGYTAGRPLALKAKDAHYDSLMVARKLCGMDKSMKEGGGATEVVADDNTARDKAITNMQATVLARAYINLANTLTQLLHFDNVEREARKRVAATTTSTHCDTTDTSSSSASSTSSLDDNQHSNLTSTLSSLATLSLSTPSSAVSLSSLAASLYSSALSLAVSHNLVEEEQRVYSNRSTLWEEDSQWQQAEDDIKQQLKQTRKQRKRNKHSSPATVDVLEQANCRARLMTLAVKAGRYEQAVKEAKERRRMVVEAAVGEDEREEREEEVQRAEEEVELMEEIRHSVRVKQTTQRLLEELEEEMDDTSSDERGNKRQRVDQSAGGGSVEVDERSKRLLNSVSEHIRLLHRYIDVCLSLAERNVDCHNNYAAALAAHQHALSLLSSLPPATTTTATTTNTTAITTALLTPPTTTTDTLTLAVHSYHLYSITRYLPWLLPQQHSADEVQHWLTTAQSTIHTCRPLARAVDRAVLALLECHLMEESGVECDEMMRVLQAAVEAVERECGGVSGGVYGGGSGGVVMRGQLLREQWHVLDVMDEEEEEVEGGRTQRVSDGSSGSSGSVAADSDSEAEVRRRARLARRAVQRTLLKGQMEVVQRWTARHEDGAGAQRAYIKCGLWMLNERDQE